MTDHLFFHDPKYQLLQGSDIDSATLLKFLQVTYGELYPQQHNYQHLQVTIDRYLTIETPLWFVTTDQQQAPSGSLPQRPSKIACLWVGIAIDQITGLRHPNIFLIYVDPHYRRQGIGRALMQHAETWARERGYTEISLQVFTNNQSAIELYQTLGYQSRSILMVRPI